MKTKLVLVLIALVTASCAQEATEPRAENGGRELVVQVASYDVSIGSEQRVIVGLLTPDQLLISYGTVDVEFFYLGTEKGVGKAREGPTATAEFLPIPGEAPPPAATDGPIVGPASRGRGVYSVQVEFDKPGFWSAQVTADVEKEGTLTGNSVFEVRRKPAYPAPGEMAPKTDNLTLDSDDAPRAAVDSRAATGKVPDPELHRLTIAESIARREPALVVFSTPVYCVSRFCGPITDSIADLAKTYGDRANFIHVEIWRNFEKQVVNKAAAEWVLRRDLTEPWVFLIGADGRIVARWDNVATPGEIEPHLNRLPRL